MGIELFVPVGQAHQVQGILNRAAPFHAPKLGKDFQVFCSGQVGIKPWRLDQAAHTGQNFLCRSANVLSENVQFAGAGGCQAQEHFHGGGFSGPVATQQAVDAPTPDVDVQVRDAFLTSIDFCQPSRLNDAVIHWQVLLFGCAVIIAPAP